MKPLLSIVVPCYNSADYLHRSVDSVLLDDSGIEILLVDDGSTDETGKIIDDYAGAFPERILALHQPNGGHGAAVTNGIYHAHGEYVKVVDSDDWLDVAALKKLMSFLRQLRSDHQSMDMIISNYIYDKVGMRHKKVVDYPGLPRNRPFSWDEVQMGLGRYLLMHSVVYRTAVLTKQAALKLPKHTFYVDELYVFEPLKYVKRLYYLDINLYHYFIGRPDQSVNENVMINRIDQALRVNIRMIEYFAAEIDPHSAVGAYMARYLEIVTTVSSVLLLKNGTRKALRLKHELWQSLKLLDPTLYRWIRRRLLGIGVNLPGRVGRVTAVGVYRIAR